jgi:hypothetical protein
MFFSEMFSFANQAKRTAGRFGSDELIDKSRQLTVTLRKVGSRYCSSVITYTVWTIGREPIRQYLKAR